MKKLLFIILAMFLSIGMFTSCEEEEEPAQQLSEYVIGKWQSQEVMLGETSAVYFYVNIQEDVYTLILTDGENESPLPVAGYTVDNDANTITIDQPTFPGDEPSDEVVPFDVIWTEGVDVMTWVGKDTGDDSPPTLIWTRSTGM